MNCSRLIVFLMGPLSCEASVLYVEGNPMMPDFSNDYENPTTLSLSIGEHEIAGSVFDKDPDFFTLIVPEGAELLQIILLNYGHRLSSNTSFIGYQSEAVLDRLPDTLGAEDITFKLFGRAELNDPILVEDDRPAGSYAFWINETSASGAGYRLNFITTAVPEPSMGVFWLGALTILFFCRTQIS